MHHTQAETVRVETTDGITTVELTNPERRNALGLATLAELLARFEAVRDDRTSRVVILRALGTTFSAGHDLRELRAAAEAADAAQLEAIFATCARVMTAMQRLPQPVIAEVAGVATAAGAQLVASCDLAVAASDARFATPGVKIGLFCSTPMVALTRSIGRKRAMEMLLTGDFIDAETAAAWGLVNRVVAPAALRAETLALARTIAAASPFVVGLGKAAFYAQIELAQADAYARANDVMRDNALDADAREGMAAFLERREPRWRPAH